MRKALMARFTWMLLTTLTIATVIVVSSWLQTHRQASQANELMRVMMGLKVGKVDQIQAMQALKPYLVGLNGQSQDGIGGQDYYFIFDNSSMARLKLSAYRRLTVRLKFVNGFLEQKGVLFTVEHDCKVEVVDRLAPEGSPADSLEIQPYHYSTVPVGFNKAIATATVIDRSDYPEKLLERDWAFRISYLSTFGGCQDARSILPTLSEPAD